MPKRPVHIATPGNVILACGAGCWGIGPNSTVAIANARKHGGPMTRGWWLFDGPQGIRVNDVGGIVYPGDAVAPVELGYVK